MPVGVRVGVRVGLQAGVAVGVSSDPLGGSAGMSSVARDATSLKYVPSTQAQWNTVLATAGLSSGPPSSIYLLQEASGNAADSAGALPLTAGGTVLYQQTVTGWARKGISTISGTPGTLLTTSAALPDIGTTSCALLAYVLLPTFAATLRTIAQLGDTFSAEASAELNGTPKTMIFQADPNTATGAVDATSVVRPIWFVVNRTGGVAALDTDLEELVAALTATPTGRQYLLGGDNLMSNQPDNCTYIYAVRFDGAAAELTKNQRRSVLQTLGWTIPW
jgi:hypothetical protein